MLNSVHFQFLISRQLIGRFWKCWKFWRERFIWLRYSEILQLSLMDSSLWYAARNLDCIHNQQRGALRNKMTRRCIGIGKIWIHHVDPVLFVLSKCRLLCLITVWCVDRFGPTTMASTFFILYAWQALWSSYIRITKLNRSSQYFSASYWMNGSYPQHLLLMECDFNNSYHIASFFFQPYLGANDI